MVISLKPLPEDDDFKAELNNLDISEETEAKADLFWANFKQWRPMMKCGYHLKLYKWNFLQMEILDEPEDGTWGVVGHKVFEGMAWVKVTRFRKSSGGSLRSTKHWMDAEMFAEIE